MSKNKFQISQATLVDAKNILILQKLCYQSEAELYEDWNIPPLTQTLQQLIDEFQNHLILKVLYKEQIIGSIRAITQHNTCYVGRLIVHPDFQKQGIGSTLLNTIESYFPNHRFELFTGDKSINNIRLYQKIGYEIFSEKYIHENLKFILCKNILLNNNIFIHLLNSKSQYPSNT